MAEVTETVAEVAEEVAEEALDFAAAAREFDKARLGFLAFGALCGAAAGAFVGYRIAYKKLDTKFEKLMAEEAALLRTHYEAKATAHKPEIDEVMEELGYASPAKDKPEEAPVAEKEVITLEPATPEAIAEVVEQNAFEQPEADAKPVWDYADEAKLRGPDDPYIIHMDEYDQNEHEHGQYALTYFEGDDVLVDEAEQVIHDRVQKVGRRALENFGHGSDDSDTVYVRNEFLETDYEITRSKGMYSVEVQGLDDSEIKHMDMPVRRRRERFDDE